MSQVTTKLEQWDPLAVAPPELFRSPNLALLCAKKIEGQFYERKSKREPELLARTICGFANSNRKHGGLLAVGIGDDGTIDGLHNRSDLNLNRLLQYHYFAGTRTEKKFVNCTNKAGQSDQILLIYVAYLEDRVAETSGGEAYIREGDQTVKLRDADRRELEYSKGQISYEDEEACPYADDVIVTEILEELRKSVASSDHIDPAPDTERLLVSKHLAKPRGGTLYLTKGGLLLLGKDPRAHLPGAYVRFIRYSGTEKKGGRAHNVVKDEVFSDPLPRLIQRVEDFLRSQFREFTFMDGNGKFLHEPEYPESAWREAIVNALVHRSYSLLNAPILLEVFDDRIEVTSPGDYPAGVHPREFIHNPRNPHLMEAMRYLRFVRMLREGSLRMREEMERVNLPAPEFSQPGKPHVRVILRNDVQRRLQERTEDTTATSEFTNLFRITWRHADTDASAEGESVPERHEIREALIDALKAHGYAVDSFFGDTAIDVGARQTIGDLNNPDLVHLYPGFKFQIVRLSDGLYVLADPTVQVTNRATLDRALAILPAIRTRGVRRGFVRHEDRWKPCRIATIHTDNTATVQLWGEREASTRVPLDRILPSLPSTWIAEMLERAGVSFDLHKTVKRLALNLSRDAARERSAQTRSIAARLSERAFPLRIRGYRVILEREPRRLRPPGLDRGPELEDPEPVFSKETEGRAPKVINGLSTYGSYDKPQRELPLVLLCTHDRADQMRALLDALRRGSGKYAGSEKTFAISFGDPIVAAVESPRQYVDKCRQICASVPSDSFFLVYCPERGYSRADYDAPYYQVKHFLLEAGFPSQMVDDRTVDDPRMKDFNLALDIFAKAGFVPWVLAQGLPDADLFLGLSYSSIRAVGGTKRLIGYVNVFDHYGRWLYYKGNTKPIRFDERNRVFGGLLADVAREYEKKAKLQRLHVHHGFKLSQEGRQEIAAGVRDVSPEAEVSFVYVNKHSLVRLYDEAPDGNGALKRGGYVMVAPNRFFISTTGPNEFGQRGMGTPRPLEVTVNRIRSKGELDARVYAQHMLSLTRLNWASVTDFCREPITLKYASDIAYLMNVFLSSHGGFTLNPRLERTPWFL